jgi:gamma-glutamylcyclotransferase (GGCT)/AIG2-like uncharacterized protein YtfP
MSRILFTYGTLMRGQRNHWRLFDSPYLGRATVMGELFQFPLFDFPILRRHPNHLVHGELYEVSRKTLAINDWHEAWYKRLKMLAAPVNRNVTISGQERISCWVYEGLDCLPLGLARRLPGGSWPS